MLPNKLQHHVFGELKSKLQPRPNFGKNNFFFQKKWSKLVGKNKNYKRFGKKKGFGPTFTWQNVP